MLINKAITTNEQHLAYQQIISFDVFIPAIKRLSTTYASYYAQMEIANQKFLAQYPEALDLS